MNKVIYFDATDIIGYEEYLNIIRKYKEWYQKRRKEIINLYKELLENRDFERVPFIIKKHNKIIEELIYNIVKEFKIEGNFGVYLSNSFARENNLLDSDIDLNFLYDKESNAIYEELISAVLVNVLGKYRDFVHDSISHRLTDIEEFEGDSLEYVIKFGSENISFKISEGNEKLMFKLYNGKKDLESFIKYYISRLNGENIDEWIYFQKPIFENNNYLSNLLNYIKVHEDATCKRELKNYIDNLMVSITHSKEVINTSSINDIRDLKRFFKNDLYKYIYETLILLRKSKSSSFDYLSIHELLEQFCSRENTSLVYEYIGNIMLLNYICDLCGTPFRTRFSQEITSEFLNFYKLKIGVDLITNFISLANQLYDKLLELLKEIKITDKEFKYLDPNDEQKNIKNYSPLSHINEMSKVYRNKPFMLPFVKTSNEIIIPMHPDTIDDLGISRNSVVEYKMVYPTSSFRTVYDEEENICYKLGILRQITRSIRNVSEKEIKRSELASKYLEKYKHPNFSYLKEEVHLFDNEVYNYIIRYMPQEKIYPWFCCIVDKRFNKDFKMKCVLNIIDIWFYYASRGIYFESFHTQNILVDQDGKIYYRDLSDIRILEEEIMRPSYLKELSSKEELHSIFFDRSVLKQNVLHFINYCEDIRDDDIEYLKKYIALKSKEYEISFPDYSMDYDKNREGHHPIKVKNNDLRV